MIKIREMQLDDLEQVMTIEEANFSVPWTETGFFTFLLREDTLFLVAEEGEKILGYCGVVTVQDEGDITNVAVEKTARIRELGKSFWKKCSSGPKRQGSAVCFWRCGQEMLRRFIYMKRWGLYRWGSEKIIMSSRWKTALL